MIDVRTHSSMAKRALLGFVFVFGTIVAGSAAPRTFAAGSQASRSGTHVAATVTTSTVAYHLAAQLVSGSAAGSTIEGQVSGTADSTGILTATLTLTNGLSATVSGTTAAAAKLTVKGKAANLTLSGSALNQKAGIWGGTVAQDTNANVGSWVLTPETQAVAFALGGKSAMGSKDKLALAGELTLNLTADGWGDGTFAFLSNDTVLPVEGRVSNGNLTATIFWPKKGAVLVIGTSATTIGVLKWSGTFAGPGIGDFGTYLGEG